MRAFMKKHDIWMRLFSVVLAIVLWAIVMGTENPEKSLTINNVAVTLSGQSSLLEEYNLSVVETDSMEIAVRIRGKNNSVTSITSGKIVAVADLSGITEPGEYDRPVQITSLSRSDVELVSVRPASVHVRVDHVSEQSVPVKMTVSGTPANGYRAGTPVTTTKNITVEGPSTELDKIEYALVTIGADGASSTVQQNCTVALCDSAGEPMTSKYLTTTTDTISVTLPIYKDGTWPLSVTLADGENVTAAMAQVTIEPASVGVYGDQNEIDSMTELNLGTIELDTVKTGRAITMPIKLPDGVNLADGQPAVATVTVTIDGMSNEDYKISNINLTDTAVESDYTARLLSDSVTVQVRGNKADLANLVNAVLTVDVRVDSAVLGPGTHVVSGKVTATGLPDGVQLLDDAVDVQVMVENREVITVPPLEEDTGDTPQDTPPNESTETNE